MIVTEKEAAEKWCPHVRYANSQDTLWSNRGDSNGYNGCIGSRCMSWRWILDSVMRDNATGTIIGSIYYSEGCANRSGNDFTIESGRGFGYCGLAGKP